MSVSFGGLVVSSVPGSLYATLRSPSMFYATVCFVAALVFAYLTNPSESSFRAFLTERSFRHHLTRLDDSPDKDTDSQDSSVYFTSQSRVGHGDPPHTRFHFANRASVAIRTPSHVYHNFVLFTVALVVPSHNSRPKCVSDYAFSDTWFLGAFGAWWRGGPLHAWWMDSAARSKDEEVPRSGLLDIKNLDTVDEYNVLPFPFQAKTPRGPPPKLREQRQQHDSTDRIQLQPPARSVTPPPLPKSVSLPLHATRHPPPIIHSHSQPLPFASSSNATSVSTNMFEQSPAIAELLLQISASRSEVHELRSQLVEFQNVSAEQRDVLHQELEVQRERKREEDSTRVELKSKTKNLEDSKRNAEGAKRDVDKKLKNAEVRREAAVREIEFLNAEISKSRERMEKDQSWIRRETEGRDDIIDGEREMSEAELLEEELAQKKVEIKVAEDVVAALAIRAKELEDRMADENERLKKVVEEAHLRQLRREAKLERQILAAQNATVDVPNPRDGLSWPPPANTLHTSVAPPAHRPDPSLRTGSFESDRSSQLDQQFSPRRKTLSLSNAPGSVPENKDHRRTLTNFTPFDGSILTATSPAMEGGVITPTILIPSGLINSLGGVTPPEMELSRSFQSDNDPFIVRKNRSGEWQRNSGGVGDGPLSNSPNSMTGSRMFDESPYETLRCNTGGGSAGGYFDPEFRPSRISPMPPSSDAMDLQRAFLRLPDRTNSEPVARSPNLSEPVPPRRWFSVKERKPLNPQAEEFNLNNPNPQSFLKPVGLGASFDALNPTSSLASSTSTTASNSNAAASSPFFYKAFAPSPAERAALGGVGTLNGSLERLPSLSDVGSLDTSPAHAHAIPATSATVSPPGSESSFARSMAWLNSLPRRKPRFSPWEDDEH